MHGERTQIYSHYYARWLCIKYTNYEVALASVASETFFDFRNAPQFNCMEFDEVHQQNGSHPSGTDCSVSKYLTQFGCLKPP